MKKLAVITPGFTADCIETLEEIDIAARETFMEAGGDAFDRHSSVSTTRRKASPCWRR